MTLNILVKDHRQACSFLVLAFFTDVHSIYLHSLYSQVTPVFDYFTYSVFDECF